MFQTRWVFLKHSLLNKYKFATMQKSVLAEIVRSLQKKEIRELNKWLASPAHNQRQDVVRLFDYLLKHLPETGEDLKKEDAWRAIYPKEPFDDAYIRQVMYFLLKAIEEYFIFKEYTKEPVRPLLSLASLYRQRKLDKPFRQTIEMARRSQESSPIRNSDYHLDKFYVEQEQYFFLADQGKYAGEVNLQKVSDELDIAFVANKLRLACRMLGHQAVYKNASYDLGFLSPILMVLKQGNMLQETGVAVYYYTYQALTNNDDEASFDALQHLLTTQSKLFPLAELRELYFHALNYCIRKINSGKESFFRRSYEIYRTGFEHTTLMEENGTVQRMTFHNAVGSALKAKEFDWAENFIVRFQQNLEEKYQHSTVQFNLARLYFEKGDYDKAQIFLRDFEYDDMLLNIIARMMLLKIYYEEAELDAFESLIESTRSFLQRKEALDTNRKSAYKNTISLMKKLLHLNPYSKPQREKLREQITATQPLMERDWLLRQVEDNAKRRF
jgi:hypothetical protein